MRIQSTMTRGHFRKFRSLDKMLCAVALCFALGTVAQAATTLTPSVTSANGELTTTLTWESTLPSCVAAGHPAWNGPKPSSGTLQLPTITLSGTYQLTLSCSSPADLTARVKWTLPTKNTDGSAYTNPGGVLIEYGRAAATLTQNVRVTDTAATAHTIADLALGQWFFAVTAINSNGVQAVRSNTVSKTMREGSSETESVSLTVNPIPGAAVLDSVE